MNASPAPVTDDATWLRGNAVHAEPAVTRAIERLAAAGRRSTAEMLQELRREFPDSPLSVRVRALEALRKR